MFRCLFIRANGDVFEDGSEAYGGWITVERQGARFISTTAIAHGRQLFIEITPEQEEQYVTEVRERGGCVVSA